MFSVKSKMDKKSLPSRYAVDKGRQHTTCTAPATTQSSGAVTASRIDLSAPAATVTDATISTTSEDEEGSRSALQNYDILVNNLAGELVVRFPVRVDSNAKLSAESDTTTRPSKDTEIESESQSANSKSDTTSKNENHNRSK